MRLRNVPGSREDIANSEFVIQEAEKHKGEISSFFPVNRIFDTLKSNITL